MWKPLPSAIESGNTTSVGDLILQHACRHGTAETVQFLLELHANPNSQDLNGETPLIAACHNQKDGQQCAQLLVSATADPNLTPNDTEGSPLFQAARQNNVGVIKVLVDNGATLAFKGDKGWGVLYNGDFSVDDETFHLLMRPHINDRGYNGETHLMSLSRFFKTDLDEVKLLLSLSADPCLQDDLGWTAIMHAVSGRYPCAGTVSVLANSALDVQNNKGDTVLMMALRLGVCSYDIVRLLLNSGAHVGLRNSKGQTALKIAILASDYWSVDILLTLAGPYINHREEFCGTELGIIKNRSRTLAILANLGVL